MDQLLEHTSGSELYSRSGIQPLSFNTIFQLYAEKNELGLALADDVRLLLMPDLFRFYLSGIRSTEYTIASTTGLLDSVTRDWDWTLLQKLGIPSYLFTDIIMPGTKEGILRKEIAE